jgi:hypothetical protein
MHAMAPNRWFNHGFLLVHLVLAAHMSHWPSPQRFSATQMDVVAANRVT